MTRPLDRAADTLVRNQAARLDALAVGLDDLEPGSRVDALDDVRAVIAALIDPGELADILGCHIDHVADESGGFTCSCKWTPATDGPRGYAAYLRHVAEAVKAYLTETSVTAVAADHPEGEPA